MSRGCAAAALAVALAFALPSAAHGAGIAVTTTGDSAGNNDTFCSLREAVRAAASNANTHESGCTPGDMPPALDVITLPANTYNLTISGNNEDNGFTGDLDHKLSTTGDLTIQGAGSDQTIIDAGNLDRAFDLGNHDFTFSQLTIRNGQSEDNGGGGAIKMSAGSSVAMTLTLDQVRLTANEAPDVGGNGGAVFFSGDDDDTLNVYNSTFDANEAGDRGGGIDAFGINDVLIDESVISGNSTTGGAGSESGGGLRLLASGSVAGEYEITDSTISGNTSLGTGGGIAADSSASMADTLTIDGSVIAGNTADDGGGGLRSVIDDTEVTESIVRDNDAFTGAVAEGGGIAAPVIGTNLDVIRSTVEGNDSDRGGGITFGGEDLRVLNTTIQGNGATQGSAVAIDDGLGSAGTKLEALFVHATVSGNGGTSAIRADDNDDGVDVTFRETILDEPGATACDSNNPVGTVTFISGTGNFDRGTSCSPVTGEQNQNTNLEPIAVNGGPSVGLPGATEVPRTMELPAASIAVDSILASACTSDASIPAIQDQRGLPRPDKSGTTTCDAGAYERHACGTDAKGATIVGTTGPETLTGTPGDDAIAGLGGEDTINGLGGDDVLCGGDDADVLIGGADDDTFDDLAGGNTLDYSSGSGVTLTYTSDFAGTATGQGNDSFSGVFTTIAGSPASDTVNGPDSFGVVFNGGDGGDVFNGGASTDTVFGQDGNDVLRGGGGIDIINGGNDADAVVGGTGDDLIDGGMGTDTASYAGAPAAVSADLTLGGASGGDGDDTFTSSSIENLTGGAFGDVLSGDGAPNTLAGGGGADALNGRGGDDALNGGAAGDELRGGPGTDGLNGGGGSADTATYSGAVGPVTANLGAGIALADGDGAGDALSGLENLTGSAFGDTLTGRPGANLLRGLAGNDTLRSQDGGSADTDDCGAGNDTAIRDVQDTAFGCESSSFPPAGQPGGPAPPPAPAPTPTPTPTPTPIPVPPSNDFDLGKLKQNKKKGIAFLFVTVPGPGELGLAGRGVKPFGLAGAAATKSIAISPGTTKLVIKPHKKGKHARTLRKRLRKKGKAKLKVHVTYLPSGGVANTQARKLKLVRKRKK